MSLAWDPKTGQQRTICFIFKISNQRCLKALQNADSTEMLNKTVQRQLILNCMRFYKKYSIEILNNFSNLKTKKCNTTKDDNFFKKI